jgi:beta-glucosidase
MKKDMESLISDMALEEKAGLLTGADWWHTQSIDRLGIPAIRMADGPYGLRIPKTSNTAAAEPATCFPVGVSMGSTWNPELVGEMGSAIGEEARERGVHIVLGPTVNIHRTPLAGRNFESFSEDPYFSARMACAYIKGMQGKDVSACVKHYALNNSEYERMTISSKAGERTIREIYLPAFEAAVKEAGVWAVMSAYNKINGKWAGENEWLLSDILKGEWEFDGIVISDWFAFGSTIGSANGGLDLEMPGPPRLFGDLLISAVQGGHIPESAIDDKIRRILRIVHRVKPDSDENKPIKSTHIKGSAGLLRKAAEEAIILLKNDGKMLPLNAGSIQSIAVIGPNAGVPRIAGGGSSRVIPHYAVTPLEGLNEFCGDRIRIRFEQGCCNHRTIPVLDFTCLSPADGSDNGGLTGRYYANNDFSGTPVFTQLDRTFIFNHGSQANNAAPGKELDPDDFSVEWTGIFHPPVTGTYRFSLMTSGFCRIILDENVLLQKWKAEFENIERKSGERVSEITLETGRAYSVKIQYCQNPAFEGFRRLRIGCEIPLSSDALNRAVEAAAESDVALVFAGLTEEYDAEFTDRDNLFLPGNQPELIRKVSRANPNTVVVLSSGSPVSVVDWISQVPAVLQAGYIGQEAGHAITNVLFGKVNPSGKLTETYPKRIEDNPAFINYPGECGEVLYGEGIFVGYRYYDMKKIQPSFPFGHGLSYTQFQYHQLVVENPKVNPGEGIRVRLNVTNTGNWEGKEVVQLYVRDMQARLTRPPKELKGFKKVSLEPGEKKEIGFEFTIRDLSYYDPESGQWICEAGEFLVMAGSSSADIRAQASFVVL